MKSDAFDLPEDVAVVCHDAGGADIIIAGLQQHGWRGQRVCMQGPAARAWQRAFGRKAPCPTPEAALDGASLLLSGTGWASELEHHARALARVNGITSIAVLDHWLNYCERFERKGCTVLPDSAWVTDTDALRIARRCFPDLPLRLVENWHWRRQLALIEATRVETAPGQDRPALLYLTEPLRCDWGRGTPGEFQALDYFAACLPRLDLPPDVQLRVRLHPAEAPGKYDDWLHKQPPARPHRMQIDDAPSLAAALARVQWVAGCETSALALALAAGRQVYCSLPPWAPPCRLPHAGLIPLAAQFA